MAILIPFSELERRLLQEKHERLIRDAAHHVDRLTTADPVFMIGFAASMASVAERQTKKGGVAAALYSLLCAQGAIRRALREHAKIDL